MCTSLYLSGTAISNIKCQLIASIEAPNAQNAEIQHTQQQKGVDHEAEQSRQLSLLPALLCCFPEAVSRFSELFQTAFVDTTLFSS